MKIFIAGPRVITELDENIIRKLNNICEKKYEILIGDADGIDSCVQKHLKYNSYKNVVVYASKGIARNNYGDWKVENVEINRKLTGFDFYAEKDLKMAKDTDMGFMIWNGKSKGTFNNMINLIKLNKSIILYYLPNKKFYQFKQAEDFESFLKTYIKLDGRLKKLLNEKEKQQYVQVSLF